MDFDGAVAQVDVDRGVEIDNVDKRRLTASEVASRHLRCAETGLRLVRGTYATAPDDLATVALRTRKWTVRSARMAAGSNLVGGAGVC